MTELSKMNQSEVKTHVTVLGVLFLLSGILFLVIGAAIFAFFFGIGVLSQDLQAMSILGSIGTIAASGLLIGAIPGLIAAYALLRRRSWARLAGIIVGAIFLMNFPIGTAIGIYAIVILAGDPAKLYFEGEQATDGAIAAHG